MKKILLCFFLLTGLLVAQPSGTYLFRRDTSWVATRNWVNALLSGSYYTQTQINSLLTAKISWSDTTSTIATKAWANAQHRVYADTNLSNVNKVTARTNLQVYSTTAIDTYLGAKRDTTYLSGITSNVQTQLNGKQASLGFTPVTNARTIKIFNTTKDLTANQVWTITKDSIGLGSVTNKLQVEVEDSLGVGVGSYRTGTQITNALALKAPLASPTFTGNIMLSQVAIAGNPTATLNTDAGNLTGSYSYLVTFITATGETNGQGGQSNAVVTSSQKIDLSDIPISANPSVIGRRIYRNKATGDVALKYLVTTLNNNVATTYTDNVADASLGDPVPRVNTTGGIVYNGSTRIGVADDGTTAFGYAALPNNTGYANTAFGRSSLAANTTGLRNSAFGLYSLQANTIGYENSAFGVHSAGSQTTAYQNTSFGYATLLNNITGVRNVALGAYAGSNETGSDQLFIDNRARGSEALGRSLSLIYGVFADAIANQSVSINGSLYVNGNDIIKYGSVGAYATMDILKGAPIGSGYPSSIATIQAIRGGSYGVGFVFRTISDAQVYSNALTLGTDASATFTGLLKSKNAEFGRGITSGLPFTVTNYTGTTTASIDSSGNQIANTLALGGATIGTNALAVTGTSILGGTVSLGTTIDAQSLTLYKSGNTRYGFGIQSGELRQYTATTGIITFGHISTTDGTTYSEKVRIDGSGNVGIGTMAPNGSDFNNNSRLLHIYQNSSDGALIKLESSSTKAIFSADNSQVQIGAISNHPLRFFAGGSEKLTLLANGTVLIGYTSDPTSGNKFAVNGNSYFNGTGTFTGALTTQNAQIANSYINFYNGSINNYWANGVDEVGVNYAGYQNSNTQFRNFQVYDGKGASVLLLTGSTKTATFAGNITAPAFIATGQNVYYQKISGVDGVEFIGTNGSILQVKNDKSVMINNSLTTTSLKINSHGSTIDSAKVVSDSLLFYVGGVKYKAVKSEFSFLWFLLLGLIPFIFSQIKKANMKRISTIILLLVAVNLFAQSKTKITMTVEKDSIAIKELAELIQDIQKLEKKWKLDVKIEFEKKQQDGTTIFFPNRHYYLNNTPNLKVEDGQ